MENWPRQFMLTRQGTLVIKAAHLDDTGVYAVILLSDNEASHDYSVSRCLAHYWFIEKGRFAATSDKLVLINMNHNFSKVGVELILQDTPTHANSPF